MQVQRTGVSRQGLKRLQCPGLCGALVYMTLSQLERHGRPVCPCGEGAMVPECLEVAAAVMGEGELRALPAWREFVRECSSVMHGQGSHIQRGRKVRAPEQIASERAAKAARVEAHARRLSGLVQYRAAADVAAEIPF